MRIDFIDDDNAGTLQDLRGRFLIQRFEELIDQAEHGDHRGGSLRCFLDRQRIALVAFGTDIEGETVAAFARHAVETKAAVGEFLDDTSHKVKLFAVEREAALEVVKAQSVEKTLDHALKRALFEEVPCAIACQVGTVAPAG